MIIDEFSIKHYLSINYNYSDINIIYIDMYQDYGIYLFFNVSGTEYFQHIIQKKTLY